MALDPNVHIQEVKALTCDIRPGRRPRGAALPAFVARHRSNAHAERANAKHVEPSDTKKTA
jgi:formate dehydrogenase major subunit